MSNKPSMMKQQKKKGSPTEDRGASLLESVTGGKEVSREALEQMENMKSAITDMMYAPESKAQVQKMLSEGQPEVTIPGATLAIFGKFEDMMSGKNGPMPLDYKLVGGVHAFTEVMELAGHMSIVSPDMGEDEMQPLMKETMQQYIQKGLKDGSIDPIELQQEVEPLLTQEESDIGMQAGGQFGVPSQLQQGQSQKGLLDKQARPMKAENASLVKQNKQMKGALQGIQQAPNGEGN
jgi:hypothetical protein